MSRMKKLPPKEFLDQFHADVHSLILEKAKRYKASHVVCFENQDAWSSQAGQRSALMVGPANKIKSLEDARRHWLNDLPSQRQYPVSYMDMDVDVARE